MEGWKEDALEYLCDNVKELDYSEATAFIDDYWQNGLSNEENLDEFFERREEQASYEREKYGRLRGKLTGGMCKLNDPQARHILFH